MGAYDTIGKKALISQKCYLPGESTLDDRLFDFWKPELDPTATSGEGCEDSRRLRRGGDTRSLGKRRMCSGFPTHIKRIDFLAEWAGAT